MALAIMVLVVASIVIFDFQPLIAMMIVALQWVGMIAAALVSLAILDLRINQAGVGADVSWAWNTSRAKKRGFGISRPDSARYWDRR